MRIKTIPLSGSDDIERYHGYDKVVPIGVGYKKYLDKYDDKLRDYSLVLNTHDEINIHKIVDGGLSISNSILIPELSIEFLLRDLEIKDYYLISRILNFQLSKIYEIINTGPIIYLENSTRYMNYFNKLDSRTSTDENWKEHEDEGLKLLLTE